MDNDFPAVMANGGQGKTFLSGFVKGMNKYCLLYTSDAADE